MSKERIVVIGSHLALQLVAEEFARETFEVLLGADTSGRPASGILVSVVTADTDIDRMVREIDFRPIASKRREHTHPNSPTASYRAKRGRR